MLCLRPSHDRGIQRARLLGRLWSHHAQAGIPCICTLIFVNNCCNRNGPLEHLRLHVSYHHTPPPSESSRLARLSPRLWSSCWSCWLNTVCGVHILANAILISSYRYRLGTLTAARTERQVVFADPRRPTIYQRYGTIKLQRYFIFAIDNNT